MSMDDYTRRHSFMPVDVPLAKPTEIAQVDPTLVRLIESMPRVAAYVTNRVLDILAMNELANALLSRFVRTDNVARMIFCDPVSRSSVTDWRGAAERTVSSLRIATKQDPQNDDLWSLIEDLKRLSPEFRAFWSADTCRCSSLGNTFIDPDVGTIELSSLVLDVRDTSGQQLIILVAAQESASADSLMLLGSLHSTRYVQQEVRRAPDKDLPVRSNRNGDSDVCRRHELFGHWE